MKIIIESDPGESGRMMALQLRDAILRFDYEIHPDDIEIVSRSRPRVVHVPAGTTVEVVNPRSHSYRLEPPPGGTGRKAGD